MNSRFTGLLFKYGLIVWFLLPFFVNANNITASNATLTGQDMVNDFVLIQFDLSWDNSWRLASGPSNWDAAWIFVKYRLNGNTDWSHCTLHYVDGSGTNDGHTIPSGATISSSNDTGGGGSSGVFVYANAALAQSTVNYTGLELRWDYGVDGILDNDDVEVNIYAIEMVYIPTGAFDLGDGNVTDESIFAFHGTTDNTALRVNTTLQTVRVDPTSTDDDAQLATTSAGVGLDGDGGLDVDNDLTIDNATFPTGYTAFYIMKYEMSQGQYVDFLNSLTSVQDGNRFPGNNGTARHTIDGISGTRTATAVDRACNFINWPDVAAYADWSALRPISEIEFEKSGRGTNSALYQEAAWGSITIGEPSTNGGGYTLSNDGTSSALISNMVALDGNALFSSTDDGTVTIAGPVRVGIFAASAANQTRIETGASYYGVMELTGNLFEPTVSLGASDGRNYDGSHGDGVLSVNGYANQLTWPGLVSSEVTGGSGIGYRGACYLFGFIPISDRTEATDNFLPGRLGFLGGRLARTAP